MPEGDTIYRTAQRLDRSLHDGTVIRVATRVAPLRRCGPQRLLGQTVAEVEARGKHLLWWFRPSELALHTHLRMSGAWHLYRPGERWRRSPGAARFRVNVSAAGDGGVWIAVCFSAPVCELLSRAQVATHPGLASLGPDTLGESWDATLARRRLDAAPDQMIGEALVDQRILAGVGNVYKSEILFVCGVDPWTPVADLDGAIRDRLLATAARLLRTNVAAGTPVRTTTGDPRDRLHVYGKAGRPCPRCAAPIRARRQGVRARITYWCPRCQR